MTTEKITSDVLAAREPITITASFTRLTESEPLWLASSKSVVPPSRISEFPVGKTVTIKFREVTDGS